jgi:hypothetical protein
LYFPTNNQQPTNKQTINMLFEIQNALGGKLIGSRSAMKTLDRLTTLLPNAKINFEVIPPVSEEIKFGSMPDLRGPVPTHDEAEPMEIDSDTPHMFDQEESDDEDDITIAELMWDIHNDITLADLAKQIIHEENRLKKEKEKEEEEPFEFVDETTFWMRSREHLPSF